MIGGNASQLSVPTSPSVSVFPLFQSESKAAARKLRLAMIGTFAPRKCGIATFTTDIRDQLAIHNPEVRLDIYAMEQGASPHQYQGVEGLIETDNPEGYIRAAQTINQSGVHAVWIQHEFGIFGGANGEMLRLLVDRIAVPIIFTFHTVLSEPNEGQRAEMEHLVSRASRIMVMTRHASDQMIAQYGASPEVVNVIPHGAPDRPFGREAEFKARLGLAGSHIITTFGLLGPGKGLERMIEAMPAILQRHPQTIYRIVGVTHPALVKREGEAYREQLQVLAERLGVERHIQWDNRFLEAGELLDQIEASDIFITPYPNLQQSTSGTLSYALALGKAVVSTPYRHARELLSDGVGVLVEPNSAPAIANAINRLLDDPAHLAAVKLRAYSRGRSTIWPEFSRSCVQMLRSALPKEPAEAPLAALPSISAVIGMSDRTGMLQHSVGPVPDRRHGYCLDDNARALMLMNVAGNLPDQERSMWTAVYASFVQHAWNEEHKRFRNFMNFDRSWCEDTGSEDSNGRAIWALGHTVAHAPDPRIRQWGLGWFESVVPPLAGMESPRAISFAVLGAACVLRQYPDHAGASMLAERGGRIISALLERRRRPAWSWFETVLGYDNPRISQALMEAGSHCNRADWVASGLETLEWMACQQTAPEGHFRPTGSETFGRHYTSMPFDQQPLEAWAAIDAAASAYDLTSDPKWLDHAALAHRWYFGANDRGIDLADMKTGRCRDGLTPRGANENTGAESILAFHLAHHAMVRLAGDAKHDTILGRETGKFDSHTTAYPRH